MDSPEYHCQLVLVTNDTAVLNAPSGGTGFIPTDSGSRLCSRCMAYRNRTDTKENASTLAAYPVHRWSVSGSIRSAR